MVYSGTFSTTGRSNRILGRPNEDAVAEYDCGTYRVVVLCDGASQCSHGQAAARLTADAVAGYLAFRFERCLLEPEDVLRRELVQTITKVLTSAAQQTGVEPSQFGCTLLAAAMDGLGRWCMFHLGDGVCFGCLTPDGEWEIASLPQYCLKEGGTSLTMNGPMFQNLRFYRQTDSMARILLLMTDGGIDLFSSAPTLSDLPKLLHTSDFPPADDCSVAWLEAKPEL